jgi:phosphotransferase system enzyme I (PtsI)
MKKNANDTDKQNLILQGIGVSGGVAIGPAFVIGQHGVNVPEYQIDEADIEKEIKRFNAGIAKTKKQLGQIKKKTENLPEGMNEDIGLLLDAYRGMVSSSRLLRGVEKAIYEERLNAEAAVQREIAQLSASFSQMNDDYLASRANDVREVGARLIRNLLRQQYNPFADAPEGSILVAEEITPADTALMDPSRISGFVAVLGGAEGHAAIMARALSLPAVLGIAALVGHVETGETIILDGNEGLAIIRPDVDTLRKYKQRAISLAREAKKLESLANEPAITRDGTNIHLAANLEFVRDTKTAVNAGAESVGLLRTEFTFMNRPQLPSEEEQFQDLVAIIKNMKGRPVTVRTLDVGGEKLATALGDTISDSPNPALGLRAIRLGLKETKILDTQLAAILRASAYGPVRILIPMVATVSQMNLVRKRLVQVEKKLSKRGIKLPPALPPLGAMIEIPGAALAADALTRVCDFFAIGSNDLTQYTLAIDRGDEQVADLYDPYHPAVLRLIQFVIASAWRANIPVSVCGELAGNPRATGLLLGLGLRQFSMSPARLLQVKQEIRRLDISDCVEFAGKILSQSDEAEITTLLDRGP